MKRSPLLVLLIGLSLFGCRYPNEFRNCSKTSAYAMLRGKGSSSIRLINGQPTSFWRWGDSFRVLPGTTTCATFYSSFKEIHSYKTAQFVAEAGSEYRLVRKRDPDVPSPVTATAHPSTANGWIIHDRRDRMTIQDSSSQIVADVPREGYVFGVSSSDVAIARYLKENP